MLGFVVAVLLKTSGMEDTLLLLLEGLLVLVES